MTNEQTYYQPQTTEEWAEYASSLIGDPIALRRAMLEWGAWEREQRTVWNPDGIRIIDVPPENPCDGCRRPGTAVHDLCTKLGKTNVWMTRLCDQCLGEVIRQAQERLGS